MASWESRTLEEVERDHVLETLKHFLGNRTKAAEALGISIRGLRIKLNGYRASGFVVEPARRTGASTERAGQVAKQHRDEVDRAAGLPPHY